jgi:hypothetical protein
LKEVEEKGKGGAGKEEETLIILSFIWRVKISFAILSLNPVKQESKFDRIGVRKQDKHTFSQPTINSDICQ